MKKLLFLPTILLLISCGSSTDTDNNQHTESDPATTQEVANLEEAQPNSQCELTVEGMTCEIGCVRTVRSHLSKMAGVTANEISFNAERVQDFVTVQYDSTLVSLSDIKEEIESIAQGIYDVTKSETTTFDEALNAE